MGLTGLCNASAYNKKFGSLTASYRILPHLTASYRILPDSTD